MKRGQWIAAVFGLALAGTLTFGVTFDAKAAGRSLIAGEWINMEGGPGVAQWKNEDGTIVEQPGVMPGDAQNSNLENTNDAQSSQDRQQIRPRQQLQGQQTTPRQVVDARLTRISQW